jgi:protein O-mannosyl-transferase
MFFEDQEHSSNQLSIPLTKRIAISIIVVLGIIVYFNCLFNGFVWDDLPFIINNPQVHQVNLPALLGPSMFNVGPFYRPIPAIYFASIYSLFGAQAFFYHVLQVMLHLLDTSLLYVFLCFFFSNEIALLLALVFLVHPMNVESVAYIGATQSELFFLPGILALLLAHKQNLSLPRVLVISCLLFLSVLTKETGFLFILMLVGYRFTFRKKRVKAFLLSAVLIGLSYGLIRLFIGRVTYKMSLQIPVAGSSFFQRFINIPSIILYYLKTFVFPLQLSIWLIWVYKTITFQSFFLPLFICLVFFALLAFGAVLLYRYNRKQFKVYLFFTIWFLLGIGMLLQLVPLDMTVADRWMYFPMVGLLGIIGACVSAVHIKSSTLKIVMTAFAIVLIGIFSIRTMVRNTNYLDYFTLYNHDYSFDDNPFKEVELAKTLVRMNMYEQALPHFEKAVELDPSIKHFFWEFNWIGNHIQR